MSAETFAPFNNTDEQRAQAILEEEFQPLRDLTPQGGAYINEARHISLLFSFSSSFLFLSLFFSLSFFFRSHHGIAANNLPQAFPFEKNFQQTFWGTNYAKLLQIKRDVDPTDVFWCSPCVGNERWEVGQDGRLCQKDE